MGTEDWVLKGTKLVTNTEKQKLKIYSRVWNFKNTVIKIIPQRCANDINYHQLI